MKDAEWAESKEKSYFRFLFFKLWSFLVIIVLKSPQISMNFLDNSKNKNRNVNFSFDSAHCASFMKMGSKLRGEGRGGLRGSVYP